MDSINGIASQRTQMACTALLLGVGLVYAVKKWRVGRSMQPSGQWREVGVVTAVKVYPVKSCRGINLEIGNVTSIGMEDIPSTGCMPLGDRRLVVYKTPEMEMVSARIHFQMLNVLIEAVSEEDVILKYGNEQIKVQLPVTKPDRKIKLWSEQVPLTDCGDEVADWLQRVVFGGKDGFRLGYYPNTSVRRDIAHLVKKYKEFYPFMRNEFTGAFSDLSPYLLLNESSVADLNKRMKERSESEDLNGKIPTPVTCENFRGNIIVKGPQPYEEDEWQWVKIGENLVFRNFKMCTRCSLTAVNPNTLEKDKLMEPITTLKTYRMLDEKRRKLDTTPAMGIYLGLWNDGGKIHVGDRVYVSH